MRREHLWARYEQEASRFWRIDEGGYSTKQSVVVGHEIEFCISNSRHFYDVDIYREGASREWVARLGPVKGQLQSESDQIAEFGCDWSPTVGMKIPLDWKPGVYTAHFVTGRGPREILFVVRPQSPASSAIVTIANNTYAAYNNTGGKSMYDHLSTNRARSRGVSFNRPLTESLGNYHLWDHFFVRWFEAEGYQFDYCVNTDIDLNPELLLGYQCNIRIGHDEYNSRTELNAVAKFSASGGNLLVISGNAFWWEVEPYEDLTGFACAKETSLDGERSWMWNEIDNVRQDLLGVTYTSMVHQKTKDPNVFRADTNGDFGYFFVERPEHWLFAETGVGRGDVFGREDTIVGPETDAPFLEVGDDGLLAATGDDGVDRSFVVLALADAVATHEDKEVRGLTYRQPQGEADAWGAIVIRESPSSGTTLTIPTIEWGHGLGSDSVVGQITTNALRRLAGP